MDGVLEFSESATRLGREKKIEGKYVISTSEQGLSVLDAVALYKELTEVESGFRQLKDVMALRPIYHQIEPRVKAHIFVAALALLVQRLLGRRLQEAGVDLSPARACKRLSTVRLVTFRLEGQVERNNLYNSLSSTIMLGWPTIRNWNGSSLRFCLASMRGSDGSSLPPRHDRWATAASRESAKRRASRGRRSRQR